MFSTRVQAISSLDATPAFRLDTLPCYTVLRKPKLIVPIFRITIDRVFSNRSFLSPENIVSRNAGVERCCVDYQEEWNDESKERAMKKIDLRKELKHLYNPPTKEVVLLRVPKFNFLMVDGAGDPNTSKEFMDAMQALLGMSYTMKFMYRKQKSIDYPVMALEGLWWMKDNVPFDWKKKEDWRWTLMVMQPKYVTKSLVKKAMVELKEKKELPALAQLRFEPFNEGLCVQIMHIGPYSAEGPTIQRLHSVAREHKYEVYGKHHEIYLSDPRRTKPEKLKTVIRQQVRKVQA